MPDPYALCPAGTGKKLKFCCADLLPELDKINHMLGAEQRLACLEHIERLEEKHPDRACLLTHKAMLQIDLGQTEAGQKTIEHTLAKFPGNPVALGEKSLMVAMQQGVKQGVPLLHEAIDNAGQMLPASVYHAIAGMAQLLLAEGHVMAARGHFILQAQLAGDQDQQPLQMLTRIAQSPSVPMHFREDLPWENAPAKAAWHAKFEQGLEWVGQGHWRRGLKTFDELSTSAADSPAVWKNLAMLRSYMADDSGAVAAWRKLASLDIPTDEAVEAEAMAQLLDTTSTLDTVDILNATYGIVDIERLQERLLSDKLAESLPVNPQGMEDDQPPPRSAFLLIDRPMPASIAGLALDDAPALLGVAYVFGRQTDREARVELIVQRPSLEACGKALERIAGDALGPRGKEEVQQQASALNRALEFNFRLPNDATRTDLQRLIKEHHRRVLETRWPQMPQALLGGKTPLEAATDPQNHLKLQAAISIVETANVVLYSGADCDAVRVKLGLPVPKTLDPWQVNPREISLARLGRVDVAKLTDEDLGYLFERAVNYRHFAAATKLGAELIERPESAALPDRAAVYGQMAALADDSAEALRLIIKARELAEAKGQSPARWLLEELSLRLAAGEEQESVRILSLLSTKHINEPGVRAALTQLLQMVGAIDQQGRPVARPAEPAAVAPASDAGGLWTPESAAAPAAGGGGSKLWLPGRD